MEGSFKNSYKISRRESLSLVVYNVGSQKCSPGYSWGPGKRDHFLIHYISSGYGRYERDGHTFSLGPGDVFLVQPEETVFYCADKLEPWEYYWVGFSGQRAALILAETAFTPRTPVLHPVEGKALCAALRNIYAARGPDYLSAVRMAGHLQIALSFLMEPKAQLGDSALSCYARDGALWLHQNYCQPLSVGDIARQLGISRSYLYRAFREEFRCSPTDYLTHCRMQRACHLLRHTDLFVHEVAASAGFADQFYFSRVFRRELRCSPTEYRAAGRSAQADHLPGRKI